MDMNTSTTYAPGTITIPFKNEDQANDFAYNHLCRYIEEETVRVRFDHGKKALVVKVENLAYWDDVVTAIKG